MSDDLSDRILARIEDEVRPLLSKFDDEGGYDCCGCSSYEAILNHAIRLIQEEGSRP